MSRQSRRSGRHARAVPDHESHSLRAHATHFLERTMRFEGTELERAMRLYHHSPVVRQVVPGRMRHFPQHDRAAIALSDATPAGHVIVTREGAFVTCLSASMPPGRVAFLPYDAFVPGMDRAEAEQEASRTFRRQVQLLSGDQLYRAIVRGPGHLSREMVQVFEMRPATYSLALDRCLLFHLKSDFEWDELDGPHVSPRSRLRIARRMEQARAGARMCLYLLSAVDEELITRQLAELLGTLTFYETELALALCRHEGAEELLMGVACDPEAHGRCRHAAVSGLLHYASHHPQRSPTIAARLTAGPILPPQYKEEGIRNLLHRMRSESPEEACRAWEIARSKTPPPPEPPEGSCWLFSPLQLNHFAACKTPVSLFFPPAARCKDARMAWDRYIEGLKPRPYEKGTPTVRTAPRTGRNEPCPCGSGRKHKHCCLVKPPEAPAPIGI